MQPRHKSQHFILSCSYCGYLLIYVLFWCEMHFVKTSGLLFCMALIVAMQLMTYLPNYFLKIRSVYLLCCLCCNFLFVNVIFAHTTIGAVHRLSWLLVRFWTLVNVLHCVVSYFYLRLVFLLIPLSFSLSKMVMCSYVLCLIMLF